MSHKIPTLEPVALGGFTLDVDYFLKKEYEDIGQASVELPAIIEWLNTQLQGMIEQKLEFSNKIDIAEANAWFNLENGGWEDLHYAGKKTAHALSLAVNRDPTVIECKSTLATFTGWVSRIQNLIYSFQSKLDIVRTAEATRRNLLGSISPQQQQ